MKLKILISGLLLSMLYMLSCEDADKFDTGKDVDPNAFTIYAFEDALPSQLYYATIDNQGKKAVIDFPFYSSDTEEISPDLTKVRINASLPIGAKIYPAFTGVIDLTEPLDFTLELMNGEKINYQLVANKVKSSKADIQKLILPELAQVVIGYGVKDGENKIFIYRTSSTIYDALKSAKVEFLISPWAEISVENGTIMDLTQRNQITVTAQDGTVKDYYTEMVDPEYVPEGEIGQITLLFGWQATPANPRGLEEAKNRSIAVSGSELIVGHIDGNFKRYDRYTGVLLDKTVNTSGTISDKSCLMGIASDDNGVLVGVTLAAVANQWIPNNVFEIYAWKNGLDSPPVKLLSKSLPDTSLSFLTAGNEIGRTISVKGDIVSGVAQIMVLSKGTKVVVRYKAENGVITNSDSPWTRTYGALLGNNAKVIPMTNADDTDYILSSGTTTRAQFWCRVNPAAADVIPAGGTWWGSDTKGAAYIEFNKVKLLAIQNATYSGTADAYNRLVVGNMTTFSTEIFNSRRVMDSRLQNFDPNVSGDQNPTITGMTSFYGAIGPNANKAGDVCFGKNEDGSAVQVYMLTTDHGIIAYDISRFVPF